jgi:hypothetical protein
MAGQFARRLRAHFHWSVQKSILTLYLAARDTLLSHGKMEHGNLQGISRQLLPSYSLNLRPANQSFDATLSWKLVFAVKPNARLAHSVPPVTATRLEGKNDPG